jgi:hypothetical protein
MNLAIIKNVPVPTIFTNYLQVCFISSRSLTLTTPSTDTQGMCSVFYLADERPEKANKTLTAITAYMKRDIIWLEGNPTPTNHER